MAITALPTPPSRSDPTNFATRADAFLTALPTFATEANVLQTDVNTKQTTASAAAAAALVSETAAAMSAVNAAAYDNSTGNSTQSKTLGTGAFTFTDVQTGRTWVAGMPIVLFNSAANYGIGTVTSYSGTTLVINIDAYTGSGTLAVWSFFAPLWYRELPVNSQSAAYTCVLLDSGKQILHPSADTTARVWTIPSNAAVAYPIGTILTFNNQNAAGTLTIAITTDTMRLAGPGTTGSRTLTANGIATAIKEEATVWKITGTNLT